MWELACPNARRYQKINFGGPDGPPSGSHAAGAISDCHVAQRTDQPEFAAAVCRAILKRGRFDPALDAHGQPVRSYRVIGFRFEIE